MRAHVSFNRAIISLGNDMYPTTHHYLRKHNSGGGPWAKLPTILKVHTC